MYHVEAMSLPVVDQSLNIPAFVPPLGTHHCFQEKVTIVVRTHHHISLASRKSSKGNTAKLSRGAG